MKKLKLKAKNARLKAKSFEFYTTVLLSSFCIFCFSESLGYAETSSKQLSDKVDKKPSHLLIAKSPTTDISRQLWQTRITNLKDEKTNKSKNELQQMIRQISSIEFEPQDQTPEPLIVVEPIEDKSNNSKAPSHIGTPEESLGQLDPIDLLTNNIEKTSKTKKLKPQPPYNTVTDQTLQILKSLSQHPDQLHNPFELAEILFNGNCLEEAAKCYQEALNRMDMNQNDQFQNKAWTLFQIGNCLRNIDPKTVMQMYRQLIAEYPNSPWTDLAKAKTKLIDWYLKDKPNTLINEHKSQAL